MNRHVVVASVTLAFAALALACAPPAPPEKPAEPPASSAHAALVAAEDVTSEQAFEVGRAYWKLKDYDGAYLAFARAAKENGFAHGWAAEAAMRRGDDEAALQHAQQHPDKGSRLFLEGLVHSRMGDQVTARARYTELLPLDPHDAAIWNNLGTTYYLERDFDMAWEMTEAVLKLPNVSDLSRSIALANLAELLMLEGDYEASQKYLDASAELTPEEAHPYFGQAILADLRGQTVEALFLMETGLTLDPDGETRFATVFAFTEQAAHFDGLQREATGQVDRARATFAALVSLRDVRPEFEAAARAHLQGLPAGSESEPTFVLPAAFAPVAAPVY